MVGQKRCKKLPPVHCLVNLLQPDAWQAFAASQDGCLVQQVGQVSASKAGSAQGNLLQGANSKQSSIVW